MRVYFNYSIRFLLILGLLLIYSNSNAQQQLMIGLGPSVELEEGIIGINTRLFYGVNEKFCFGPEITFFPYQEINDDYELTVTDLNFNAHYIVELSHEIGIYPLSGLNYTIEKEQLIEQSDGSEKDESFGWNYGFGAHYKIGDLFAFAEFKGVTGKLSDEFITVGILFTLSKHKQNTDH
ncbi:outer membrane beta-barrel protein [uncultured Aquimarina sp.]|uniref:outer membrane beta-barrel protein n=1 Tax=uncultured Aquimarina sp. TaxID=575652 RepID=UPI002624A79B|nr:outer membrane beta-barrel protein [uncultured Aquimarina sp.]